MTKCPNCKHECSPDNEYKCKNCGELFWRTKELFEKHNELHLKQSEKQLEKQPYTQKELVVKKIKEAGWATRLVGIVFMFFAVIGIVMAIILSRYSYLTPLIWLAIITIPSVWIGNVLYKDLMPIQTARLYLKIAIIVLLPAASGLLGFFAYWQVFGALSAINKILKPHKDTDRNCNKCGKPISSLDYKCHNCGEVFWRTKEGYLKYMEEHHKGKMQNG